MVVYPDFPNVVIYSVANHPGTGYQAKITISWKPGMGSNFRDVRFHDQNEAKIPYWIETYTSFTTATIWIQLTAFKQIYLRYGNGAAKSESNGNNVFPFFDDFNGSTLDATKWVVSIYTTPISNSICSLTRARTDTTGFMRAIPTFGVGYVMRTLMQTGSWNSPTRNLFAGWGFYSDATPESYMSATYFANVSYDRYVVQNTTGSNTSVTLSTTDWGASTFAIAEWGRTTNHLIFSINDVLKATLGTTNYPTQTLRPSFYSNMSNVTGSMFDINWVLVRKYATIEPTFTYVSSGFLQSSGYLNFGSGLLKKTFSASNKISLFKTVSSNSDIDLFNLFSVSSKIDISTLFATSNAIISTLINKIFSNSSDISLISSKQSSNDVEMLKSFLSSNDLTLYNIYSS